MRKRGSKLGDSGLGARGSILELELETRLPRVSVLGEAVCGDLTRP
jgi:hypothetical protein